MPNAEITQLEAIVQSRKTGNELFHSNEPTSQFSLIEFWQWTASDLISNATRGRLAEFLVAKALGLAHGTRTEWDAYDLLTPSGLKIEVKSCAYLQSWRQLRLSPISFAIPLTRAWDEDARGYEETPVRQADVYVFALLAHTDKTTVDALDLDQWHFYVVPTSELNDIKSASITLKKLQSLGKGPLTWSELPAAIRAHEN